MKAGERSFESDRIDVRMGYGEEGLVRALDFGVQRKEGYLCDSKKLDVNTWAQVKKEKVSFNFDSIPIFRHFFDLALWKQSLWPGRRDVWVWYLQKYLVKLGYLHKNKQTGTFDRITQKALCRYQTKRLISSPQYSDCGVFGPRTRTSMKNELKKRALFPQNLWEHTTIQNVITQARSWDEASQIIEKTKIQKDDYHFFDHPFVLNRFDPDVVALQYLLQYLNYFQQDVDGIFDLATKEAVYKFQLNKHILK
ncbi:MAG: peptidoglycan-binding protein [bacterium]|nr:peptidoglycan-binding protein [bacterium]